MSQSAYWTFSDTTNTGTLPRLGLGGNDPGGSDDSLRCSIKWEPLNARQLAEGDFRPDFLFGGLLIARQPVAVVGGSKTLKTTIGLDAAISLASGMGFLKEFVIEHTRRVAFLSGESGAFTIQETAKRTCASRGVDLASLSDMLLVQFRLLQLALAGELDALAEGLERDKIDVLFLDPLYLSLLSGSQGIDASNMYQMGPLLLKIATVCLDLGCTPVLLHHTNRPGMRKFEPLELSDIAFAGVPEFARQWWLLSRREPYHPGSGVHALYLSVGGSVGHGGLWHLDVNEGKLAEDFTGRKWDVTVTATTMAKKGRASDREQRRLDQMKADEQTVAECIDRINSNSSDKLGATQNRIRGFTGLSQPRTAGACERLLASGLFVTKPRTFKRRNGRKYTADVFQRVKDR